MSRLLKFCVHKTAEMDVAPWCYKWIWMDWISVGGMRHRSNEKLVEGCNEWLKSCVNKKRGGRNR